MGIDIKIIQEIKRHNSINKYIMEQDAPVEPDPAALPPLPATQILLLASMISDKRRSASSIDVCEISARAKLMRLMY